LAAIKLTKTKLGLGEVIEALDLLKAGIVAMGGHGRNFDMALGRPAIALSRFIPQARHVTFA
jgi:hypothetical protein